MMTKNMRYFYLVGVPLIAVVAALWYFVIPIIQSRQPRNQQLAPYLIEAAKTTDTALKQKQFSRVTDTAVYSTTALYTTLPKELPLIRRENKIVMDDSLVSGYASAFKTPTITPDISPKGIKTWALTNTDHSKNAIAYQTSGTVMFTDQENIETIKNFSADSDLSKYKRAAQEYLVSLGYPMQYLKLERTGYLLYPTPEPVAIHSPLFANVMALTYVFTVNDTPVVAENTLFPQAVSVWIDTSYIIRRFEGAPIPPKIAVKESYRIKTEQSLKQDLENKNVTLLSTDLDPDATIVSIVFTSASVSYYQNGDTLVPIILLQAIVTDDKNTVGNAILYTKAIAE